MDKIPFCDWVEFFFCLVVFHAPCVDEWLKNWNRICPLCKGPISRSRGHTEREPLLNDLESRESSSTYGSIRLSNSTTVEGQVISETETEDEIEDRNTNPA